MEADGPSSRKRKSAGFDPDEAAAVAEGHGPESEAEEQEQDPPPPVADGGAANGRISHLPTKEGARTAKKRKSEGFDSLEAVPAAAGEGHGPKPAAEDQEPPLPVPVADGDAVNDHISHLPDGVLGDVISLLPTKEGARTQALASRWRHLWPSAPLNLDYRGLCQDGKNLGSVMSRILSAHHGPARRFCAPVYHVHGNGAATADAWLQSPALRNLQELELRSFQHGVPDRFTMMQPSQVAVFRFSETLCVATIGDCQVPSITAPIHFPKLKKLELVRVTISDPSLDTMIKGCCVLECLLIAHSHGFRCVQINSGTLRSVCVKGIPPLQGLRFEKLVIENAPCLQRFLQQVSDLRTSVISAPKLETIGYLSYGTTLVFDAPIIQGLPVDRLTSEVCSVKIVCVGMGDLSLDGTIHLMRFFPCLERLHIESGESGEKNLWHRKHRVLIRSMDIRVKNISWQHYGGSWSHVNFAMFFVLNTRVLELMTFQVYPDDYNEEFFAQQHKKLRLDSKASSGARFRFTPDTCHRYVMDFGVHDLDLADPFEATPSEFYDLS